MLDLNLNGVESFYGPKGDNSRLTFGAFNGSFNAAVFDGQSKGGPSVRMTMTPFVVMAVKSAIMEMISAGPGTTRWVKTNTRNREDFTKVEPGPSFLVGKDESMMIYMGLKGPSQSDADVVKYYFKRPMTLEIGESGDDKQNNINAAKDFVSEVLDKKAALCAAISAVNGIQKQDVQKRLNNLFAIFGPGGERLTFGAYNGFVSASLWVKDQNRPVSKLTLNNNIIAAFRVAVETVVKGDANSRMYIHRGTWDQDAKKVVQGVALTFGKDENGICYIDYKDKDRPEPIRFRFQPPKTVEMDDSFTEGKKSALSAMAFSTFIMGNFVYQFMLMSRDKEGMSRFAGGNRGGGGGNYQSNQGGGQQSGGSSGGPSDDIPF